MLVPFPRMPRQSLEIQAHSIPNEKLFRGENLSEGFF